MNPSPTSADWSTARQQTVGAPLQTIPELPPELVPFVYATVVLVGGLVTGYLVGRLSRRLLVAVGIPDGVEGTAFERTTRSFGSSTVDFVARLSSWFVYAVTLLAAINIAGVLDTDVFWLRVTEFVPRLFVAALVVVVGVVVADKAELLVSERLRGIKLPEVNLAPKTVKYSVLLVAALVALAQLGVQTLALVALLTVYTFGMVLFGALAFRDFLSSGAAGVYLLLNQPYGIGDQIRVGDREGVVQGMNVFVTRVENDTHEYVIPNRLVIRNGVVRVRE
jgi:small-conductance mechanosensitive channel